MRACVSTFKATTETLHQLGKYPESGELFYTLRVTALMEKVFSADVETDIICCISGVCPETKHDIHLWPGWRIGHEFAFSPVRKMKG